MEGIHGTVVPDRGFLLFLPWNKTRSRLGTFFHNEEMRVEGGPGWPLHGGAAAPAATPPALETFLSPGRMYITTLTPQVAI